MKVVFILSLMPKWIGISRLPKALKEEDFVVVTLSPYGSYLSKTRFADYSYTFNNQLQLRRLILKIVGQFKIDYIIPGDDLSVHYLNQIVKKRFHLNRRIAGLQKIIRFSYNGGEILSNKSELQSIANENGIHTPRNIVVKDLKQVLEEANNREYPLVLKSDLGVAGTGVRICHNIQEVRQSYQQLMSRKSANDIIRNIKNTIKRWLLLPVLNIDFRISIQNYVKGESCIHETYCSNGTILSSVTMLKERSYPDETSPSCVVRVIENSEVQKAAQKLIKKLNYTGFASFDFMLDHGGKPILLECNTRPTPVTHICKLMGGNLVAMIKTHMGLDHDHPPYQQRVHDLVALYPNEQKRDTNSYYIHNHFHDIPEDDPELTSYMIQQ